VSCSLTAFISNTTLGHGNESVDDAKMRTFRRQT